MATLRLPKLKVISLLLPYKVYKSESGYYFKTNAQIEYFLYFNLPDDYIENSNLSNYFLEFGFYPTNAVKNPVFDERIGLTIISFIISFFKTDIRALIYYCQFKDKKDVYRSRLFTKWFNKYKDLSFEKIDKEILIDENIYYSSMLLSTKSYIYNDCILKYESSLNAYVNNK